MFTYATVCSGVEGCSLALEGMGWKPVFFSEIEPFPCAVLKHHYQEVPNLGDMSKIRYEGKDGFGIITNGTVDIEFRGRLDLLAGGTPCQDFSVAGKRQGGAEGSGTRSSLCWEFLRLVSELRPRTVLWENVAGCLSSNNGRDFSQFVAALGKFGYCVGWRVLDAQFCRVDRWPMAIPQRRRRVWLVATSGTNVTETAKILFEPSSIVGYHPPRRITREEVARASQDGDRVHASFVKTSHARGRDGLGERWEKCEVVGTRNVFDISETRTQEAIVECFENHPNDSRVKSIGDCCQTLTQRIGTGGGNLPLIATFEHHGQDSRVKPIEDISPTLGTTASNNPLTGNNPLVVEGVDGNECDPSPTISTKHQHAAAIAFEPGIVKREGRDNRFVEEATPTLRASAGDNQVAAAINHGAMQYTVRRLTPTECERLMGYPDGYTVPMFTDITDELVDAFVKIHNDFNALMSDKPVKPKTAKQIRKWLETISNPETCSDAPRYKVCGNGWAINCARWVLQGVDKYLHDLDSRV